MARTYRVTDSEGTRELPMSDEMARLADSIRNSDVWCRCSKPDPKRVRVEHRGHSADAICMDCGGARCIG